MEPFLAFCRTFFSLSREVGEGKGEGHRSRAAAVRPFTLSLSGKRRGNLCLWSMAVLLVSLLTPAALPAKPADPNWFKQRDIVNRWKKMGQSNPRGLQMQLLQASSAARYPHAYLFKHLLTQEMTSSTPGQSWHVVWDTFLQQEMSRGSSATYQTCLHLRLLICADNQAKRQEIADEVMPILGRVEHARVSEDQVFYLLGGDLFTAAVDQILGAALHD